MRLPRRVPVVMLLLLALLLTGCLGDDDDSDESNATPNASATGSRGTATPVSANSVLTAAAERWSEIDSAHFKLTVEGNAFIDDEGSLGLREAEGDLKRPDSVKAIAKITFSVLTQDVSIIAIGNDMWMTSFVDGEWEKAPIDFGFNPAVLFSASEGFGPALAQVASAKLEDDEEVDGTDAYVVSGTVGSAAISPITAGAIESDDVPIKVWISKGTHDILKVVFSGATASGAEESTWTLVVSKHNEPVEIEEPELGT